MSRIDRVKEGYYKLNPGDKNTDKVFIGYKDGTYQVEYTRPEDTMTVVRSYYKRPDVIYLYTQHRPFSQTARYTIVDKTYQAIKRLETEAESYINLLAEGRTGRGKHLGSRLADCRDSFNMIKEVKRWTRWQSSSGKDIKEYYRRREHE